MATMKAMNAVASAVKGLDVKVAETFVEQAGEIADAALDAWEGYWEIPADELTTVVNKSMEQPKAKKWSKKTREARKSEYKAIILAYPWLKTAAMTCKRELGELRRAGFLTVARECVKDHKSATAAGKAAAKIIRDRLTAQGKKTKPKTPAAQLGGHMRDSIDLARKVGNDTLANALTKLARTHKIKVS